MDSLAKKYLKNQKEFQALELIRECRIKELYNLGCLLGEYFSGIFSFSKNILDEYGICLFYVGKNKESHNVFQKLINFSNLDEYSINHYIFNDHFNYRNIIGTFSEYNKGIVDRLAEKRVKTSISVFTFSITSCKRLDLFTKTINSFLNCCQDLKLITKWICVDDNSTEEDRKKMQELYPFFTFIFKGDEEKGHCKSMNIIKNLVKTPYLCHLEDDWEFFIPKNYLTEGMEILNEDDNIKQCLFNRNYAETINDIDIKGGIKKSTQTGLNYFIHDKCASKAEFESKYGKSRNCTYWPHFSFRPSILKAEIFEDIGDFDENSEHFEMNYANRYFNKGFRSAFFSGIYCIHIGRLTTERNNILKKNAYDLNNTPQFVKSNFFEKTDCLVVNLDHREDRMKTVLENFKCKIKRFPAVNGFKLKRNIHLSRIFDGNDYNMRKGMVGCAMSHIKIMIDFLKSEKEYIVVLEDDAIPVPDFEKKLIHAYNQLPKDNDIFYIGHHLRKEFTTDKTYDKKDYPKVFKWSNTESLQKSMGGTFGYLLSKKGATNMLEFIDKYGMTNGIDTVQQKSGVINNLYYCEPMLVHSECYRGDNEVDSDIQFNYDSLTIPIHEIEEIEYKELTETGENIISTISLELCISYAENEELNSIIIYNSTVEGGILNIIKKIIHPYYMFDKTLICFFPNSISEKIYKIRGITRLKWKNELYSVDKAI
jgi:GR25 family glycosyltransferase involved in LPS biosynthesis